MNLVSPEKSPAASGFKKEDLPDLRRASDVLYGVWKSTKEGQNLGDLKYYVVAGISNADSKAIITRAYGSSEIAEYPGKTIGFLSDDMQYYRDEGLAMLGSPVSQPLAYMCKYHPWKNVEG